MQAMGLDPAVGEAAVRVSLGVETTEEDIGRFLLAWGSIHEAQRKGWGGGVTARRLENAKAGAGD